MSVSADTLYRWREAILDVVPLPLEHDERCPQDDTCECNLEQSDLDSIANEMLEAYLDAIRKEVA